MSIMEIKKPDLRHKLKRPDDCISYLQHELIKTGTKTTKAYKCWEEMLVYIKYLEGKMERMKIRINKFHKEIDND